MILSRVEPRVHPSVVPYFFYQTAPRPMAERITLLAQTDGSHTGSVLSLSRRTPAPTQYLHTVSGVPLYLLTYTGLIIITVILFLLLLHDYFWGRGLH